MKSIFTAKNLEIWLREEPVDCFNGQQIVGYFKQKADEEEYSGHVWFEKCEDDGLKLVTYDGVPKLSEEVVNALIEMQVDVSYLDLDTGEHY